MHRIPPVLLAVGLIVSPALAQQNDSNRKATSRPTVGRQAQKEARKFRHLELPGDKVAANIEKLTGELKWHKTLSGALQSARGQKKPVLWIHALGDIDGFL